MKNVKPYTDLVSLLHKQRKDMDKTIDSLLEESINKLDKGLLSRNEFFDNVVFIEGMGALTRV